LTQKKKLKLDEEGIEVLESQEEDEDEEEGELD